MHSSLKRILNITEKYEYRVLPVSMTDKIDKDVRLSNISKIAWTVLHKLVIFSADWSVIISNKIFGEKINRSVDTVNRAFNQLEKFGYIIKERICGKSSKIYVRFPDEFIDQIENKCKPCRKFKIQTCRTSKRTTSIKNAACQDDRSYIIYNTNNNSTAHVETVANVIAKEPIPIVVDLKKKEGDEDSRKEDEKRIEICIEKIQKIDTELVEIRKITQKSVYTERISGENPMAWMKRMEQNKTELYRENYEREKKLEQLRNQLNNEIVGVQNSRKPKPESAKNNADYKWARSLPNELTEKIKRSTNKSVGEEIILSLKHGNLPVGSNGRQRSIDHSANIFLSVARTGKWTTPRFMLSNIS